MAKIISITNTKGGTGKSTVTILLASALALEDKKRVLVLDCDAQQSIASLRNMEQSEDGVASFDVKAVQPQFLSDMLEAYSQTYDYIFLDLPRITNEGQSGLIYTLLAKCEFVFIPIVSSGLVLSSTLAFLEGVQELEDFKKEQDKPFLVRGFFNEKERDKDNADVYNIIKSNGLEMMRYYLARLRIFKNASTIENPLSFTDGLLRFKPFYTEFKRLVRYE